MTRLARGPLLVQLVLVLALAASTGQGESRHQPPEPPAQTMDGHLSPLELLELGAPAVRYLRAFTTQCWLPDQLAPIAMFDNSWAVALVTIWNDLTVPSNGLGRLVTAMQLQTEAALMIEDQRPADALSVLELAVLFTLYPVHHEVQALAAWHHSLASNTTMFASRRLSLARTLSLMTRAQAAVGAAARSVDALEAAMIAGRAARELFTMSDPGPPPPTPSPPGREADSAAAGLEGIEKLLAEVARNTARALREANAAELEHLLDKRGLRCRWNCGRRSSLLKVLVPALAVPLRLVAPAAGEEAFIVEPAPEQKQQQALRGAGGAGAPIDSSSGGSSGGGISSVERLGGIFAQVVATLQQPLLSDVGIKCTTPAGLQLLHSCREQAAAQFGRWAAGAPVAHDDMAAMLSHVTQVEEALWRLDQVLEQSMSGVRLGDGTTWVKNRGYTWVLGAYTAAKLYPHGQGAPAYYHTRRPTEPNVGSTVCLDKTYLLDTVLRLDPEGLRGLQYALDNLHYAQFHAGGHEPFWRLLSQDNPMCSGAACQTGEDPLSALVQAEAEVADGHGPLPTAPRPMMIDFRFVSEQQLQANLAAATDPRYRVQDPFVAAFLSFCLVSVASLYLYSHRSRLVRALTPQKGRAAAAAGASLLVQRSATTAALREALAGDNVSRQNVQKLVAAIDAAEATGVEKPLVKKAKAALQALKKRKQQQQAQVQPAASVTGGAGGGSSSRQHPAPVQAQPQPPQPTHQQQQLRGSGGSSGIASALQHTSSGLSSDSSSGGTSLGTSSSLGRSLSEGTATLLAAAARGGWLNGGSDSNCGSLPDLAEEECGSSSRSSAGGSGDGACSPMQASRATSLEPPPAAAYVTAAAGAGPDRLSTQSLPAATAAAAASVATPDAAAGVAAAVGDIIEAATPPRDPLLPPFYSDPPTSPGTPVESVPRSSPGDSSGDVSTAGCTPLPSPTTRCGDPTPQAAAGLLLPSGHPAAGAEAGSAPAQLLLPDGHGGAPPPDAAAATVTFLPSHAPHPPTSGCFPSPAPASDPSQVADECAASDSGSACTPTAASCAAAAAAAAGMTEGELAAQRQLTPRQQKKLLRLQQKRSAAAAAAALERLAAGSEEAAAAVATSAAAAAGGSASRLGRFPPRPLSPLPPLAGTSPIRPAPASAPHQQQEQPEGQQEPEGEQQPEQQQEPLSHEFSRKQQQARAAREESAPTKQPKSAKRKQKQQPAAASAAAVAAPPSHGVGAGSGDASTPAGAALTATAALTAAAPDSSSSSRPGSAAVGVGGSSSGAGAGAGVRRTLSESLSKQPDGGVLSLLRQPGAASQDELLSQDTHLPHVNRWPDPDFWQLGNSGLNAHAPAFSPSPNRPRPARGHQHGSPAAASGASGAPDFGRDLARLSQDGMGFGLGLGHAGVVPYPPALLRSPFVGAHAGGGGGGGSLSRTRSVPFTAGGAGSGSLSYPSSAASSLELQHQGGEQQQQQLLAQLQQIWGESSGGGSGDPAAGGKRGSTAASPLPGFGAGMGASPAAAAMLAGDQQQQQLVALLFMHQQLEQQQQQRTAAALALRCATGVGGHDSPPGSPQQQLPPASADMLRDVLGSPLALLPHGSGMGGGGGGSLGWPGLGGGVGEDTLRLDHSATHSSRQPATARSLALSQRDESAEVAAQAAAAACHGLVAGGGTSRSPLTVESSVTRHRRFEALDRLQQAPAQLLGAAQRHATLSPAEASPTSATAALLSPAAESAFMHAESDSAARRIESMDLEQLGFFTE